jgi:hypothetical protein
MTVYDLMSSSMNNRWSDKNYKTNINMQSSQTNV